MRHALAFLTIGLLCGCVATNAGYKDYLERRGIPETTEEFFAHCRGYGCKYIDKVDLNKKQWRKITKAFRPKAKTAEKERAQIAKAIAIFEQEVGAITGTEVDHHGTFKKMGTYQQDCVDESVNTTIYLDLLQEKGLLNHHSIRPPAVRLPLIHSGRWPHQTAIIMETETEESFVVDSWFHDNGAEAEIVPLKTWRAGWKPEKDALDNQ